MDKTETTASKSKRQTPQARTGRMMLYILLGLAFCITAFMVAVYPVVLVGAPTTARIKIPKGATAQNVRDSLTKYMGESYASDVMMVAKLRNVDYSTRYGSYKIAKGTNALGAMRKLTSGAQTPVRITINGFRSLPLLVNRISSRLDFPADSLWKVIRDPKVLDKYGLNEQNALALFIDDTYEVYWSSSPEDVIKKIGDNYKFVWGKSRVKRAADMGLTPAGLTTIASIADEETNVTDEKPIIGQLYINRLRNNMKLQSDPTVRYALGDYTIRRVTKKHLQVESPYNTYKYAGLPPGPIRTTSARTIKDILEAKPNAYLYMCAREDFSGRHSFAVSYTEHLENAKRYQQALDRNGITH